MKRDLNIMREVLKNADTYTGEWITDEATIYHIKFMTDAELIDSKLLVDGDNILINHCSLKEKGYDLLTHITNDYVWDEVKERLSDNDMTVNDVPIDIIKWLAKDIMEGMFGSA